MRNLQNPAKTHLYFFSKPAYPAKPSSYENENEPSLVEFSQFERWVFWITRVQPR